MRAYLAIIRPYNILLTLLTQAVFMVAASRTNYINIDWENISFPQSYLVILTCCLTAAGGYVINDLFDVDTDHVNRPNKRILKREAMGLPGNLLIALISGSVIYVASRGINEINRGYFAEYTFLAFY